MVLKKLKLKFASLLSEFSADEGESSVDVSAINAGRLAAGLGTALLAGILGSSPGIFSCYPFGIAYLCAADKYVLFSYIGLVLSALFSREYALPLTVVLTAALMLRYSAGKLSANFAGEGKRQAKKATRLWGLSRDGGVFNESLLLRCTEACFCAFVFGLYRLISGGFLYYDLFGLLAGFLITPICTLALSGIFTKEPAFPRAAELSAGALLFITVFSLRGHMLLGFSLPFMAAVFATLWAASHTGALRSCTVGLLAGLAAGSVNILSAPDGLALTYSLGAAPCILAAMGLTAGAIWRFSSVAALSAACTVGITFGLAIDGFPVLSRIIPDVICSAVIFAPLSRFSVLPRFPIFLTQDSTAEKEWLSVLEKKQSDTVDRISALSEAFAKLADTVYSLSDRLRRPAVADLKEVCDGCFESYCQKCSISPVCWEKECGSTLDALGKLTAKLYSGGRIGVDDVPEYLKGRCYNILPIIDDINISVGRLIEQLIKNDRTEAFALDYETMSKLLAEQISRGDAEYKTDDELTKSLRNTLKYINLGNARAVCYGSRKKHIIIEGAPLTSIKLGTEELQTSIENTVGTELTAPIYSIDGDTVTLSLDSRRRFGVEVAKATGIKENEKANGDSAVTFDNREDYFYVLVSDGMGSGREAAITSKICTVFLERMLGAGNGKAVALEMLNGFIRSRGTECSATVDLAEIDLITGEACFVKSGAAPSFVLRGSNLYKLQSKTVPIGIMRSIDAEKIKFELMPGDVIVMISDGVAQSLEDGIWLANLLTYEWEDDLSRMAEKILDNAALCNKRSDDMTVALVKVSENTAPDC